MDALSGARNRERILFVRAFVGQSFGFASELPLGPELAILPMKRREIIANRVGRKADGGAEAGKAEALAPRKHGGSPCLPFVSLLLWLCLLALTPSMRAVEASPPSEFQIKAAFLLNFTKFIEWPANESAGSAFSICVLGEDPFGPVLDQLVEGETVGGRKVAVRRIRAETAGSCEILYVSKQEQNIQAVLAGAGAGVLTVGEGDGFLDDGGMIAFILENRRVRFNIDRGAAQKAGLKLSSRLLAVARSVR